MRTGLWKTRRPESGFSLVEVLIVVAIIVIMAAVSLPNIGQYIRNYKIRGATNDVVGEIQATRTKAIMGNTNNGVSFVIVDADSYRFVREDGFPPPTAADPDERLGPLRHLPVGVRFQAGGACAAPGDCLSFRYNRLGAWCKPGSSTCTAGYAGPLFMPPEAGDCGDNPVPGTVYMRDNPAANGGGTLITLIETSTGLQRTVRVTPGGRAMAQQ